MCSPDLPGLMEKESHKQRGVGNTPLDDPHKGV